MGCNESREKDPTNLRSEEMKVFNQEKFFPLCTVDFRDYRTAIKKYGHQTHLNIQHINEILLNLCNINSAVGSSSLTSVMLD